MLITNNDPRKFDCTKCEYRKTCMNAGDPTLTACTSYLGELTINNQEAKQDAGKAKLSLVPRRIIWDIATIREYGNNKYPDGGPDNWRQVEVERYRDALCRHLLRYLDDPKGVDTESGYPHLWHMACNIAFLCELEDEELKRR